MAKVVALLDPLVTVSTDDLGAVYLMGTALARDNQAARSQIWLDRILSKGDTAEAHLLIGTAKLMANEISAARVDLEKAVALNPKLPGRTFVPGAGPAAPCRYGGGAGGVPPGVGVRSERFRRQPAAWWIDEAGRSSGRSTQAYWNTRLSIRAGDFAARYQIATIDMTQGKIEEARAGLESIVKETPEFTEAHVSLATVYYRLKRKDDGDRERDIVKKLNAAQQARQKRPPAEEPAKP